MLSQSRGVRAGPGEAVSEAVLREHLWWLPAACGDGASHLSLSHHPVCHHHQHSWVPQPAQSELGVHTKLDVLIFYGYCNNSPST